MDSLVYVSNVAKRRPPENRKPTSSEIAYYLPVLLEEIRLVDPEFIVLAGAVPLMAILGLSGISKVRGQWFEDYVCGRTRRVMPIFHPSYLLRNQTKKLEMKVSACSRTLRACVDMDAIESILTWLSLRLNVCMSRRGMPSRVVGVCADRH